MSPANRNRIAMLLCAAGSLAASTARAQALDPQHYQPAPTLTGLSTVKGGASQTPRISTLSFTSIYAREPLVVRDRRDARQRTLIADRLDVVFAYAIGFAPPAWLPLVGGIDVAAVVPFVPLQRQEASFERHQLSSDETYSAGLADPRLEARVSILSQSRLGLDLAVVPVVSFPTAAGGGYLGSESVVFAPELAASRDLGSMLVAANLGYRVRGNKKVGGLELGDQLSWRAGVGLRLASLGGPQGALLSLEAYGLTRGVRPFRSVRQSPTEIIGSVRQQFSTLVVTAGAGTGLNTGYGAPRLRVIMGLAWSPGSGDVDGDTLIDAHDRCPLTPEDPDAFRDDDGCPELDNDHDGIPDTADACPQQPEDYDAEQDEDGCPDR